MSKGTKILLVDDDAFLRDMYATKFGEEGYDVSVAENGDVAQKCLQEDSFDVVLLDLVMPGVSGLELLKQMQEEQNTNETAFIILSNQGSEEEIQIAQEAGAKGYIIKAEMIPSEVVSKVESLTGS